MSLVSNFIGAISPFQFGQQQTGMSESLNSDTRSFADILQKQINEKLGIGIDFFNTPEGMNILDFTNTQSFNNNPSRITSSELKDMTTSEVVTFLHSTMDRNFNLTQNQDSVFDFARKQATEAYGKYARNIVTNINEFVSDAIKVR